MLPMPMEYYIVAYWYIIKLSLDIARPDYISPEIKQSQYDMVT